MKKIIITVAVLALVVAIGAIVWLQSDWRAELRQKEADAALELIAKIEDPAERVEKLTEFIKRFKTLENYVYYANYYRFFAYKNTEKPDPDEMLRFGEELIDSALPEARAEALNEVAYVFAELEIHLDAAEKWAREALEKVSEEDKAMVQDTLGWALFKQDRADEAMLILREAVSVHSYNGVILSHAGECAEKLGLAEEAIDYYIRKLSVFGYTDKTAFFDNRLKPLHIKTYGSDKGLEDALKQAKERAFKYEVFDTRRAEGAAPDWKLPGFEGDGSFDEHKGRVVLLDFWGHWCPPCKLEMPHLQTLYEKLAVNPDVSFVAIHWKGGEALSESQAKARQFLAEKNITFPTYFDVDSVAVKDYGVKSFPTTFIVDKKGNLRYKNVGYTDAIEEILSAQIESLLKES